MKPLLLLFIPLHILNNCDYFGFMKFVASPILDKMIELYKLPRNRARFDAYLKMLQGESQSEMISPIAGYNPMGKDFVLEKMNELKGLEAEVILSDVLKEINTKVESDSDETFDVVINLLDDIGGGWSEHCSTDYNYRFNLSSLIKRKFVTPFFWTSEEFDENMIARRIQEQVYRTIYELRNGKSKTLQNHVDQEVFVKNQIESPSHKLDKVSNEETKQFLANHSNSEKYALIFNFFYGDKASENLGYKLYGNHRNAGIELIQML